MISVLDKSSCCGCSACVQRCPKQCITLKEDEEGFLYPHVDRNKCIECNLCKKVCPLISPSDKISPIKVLAVKNRDEEERMASSSGGVFIALAKNIINHGGVVFGAVFDEKWEVKHIYTETIEGIKPMMGSKYLQSRIENTFLEAELFLKQGRKVMFTGTPCQIVGLKKYLRKEYSNLLAVDLLCHGVPSPGIWRKYLNDFKAKYRFNISDIEFRNKALNGWKNYSFVVKGIADSNKMQYSCIHRDNSYMRGFLSNLYLRPSCYQCQFKNGVSHSDITIADYWGINIVMPEFDDDKGIGLVLLNSQKGKSIFSELDVDIRYSSLSDAQKFNGGFKENIKQHIKRKRFFKELKGSYSVEKLIIKFLKVPFLIRVMNGFILIAKRCIVSLGISGVSK